ncbi:MAG TPA: UPF0182 family protein [Bradyrhizobium sp.]|nr:UPF0182 family protein [Bradyrhizobium sp.]
MFQFGYLVLIFFAAFPLGRTFLSQRAGVSPVVFAHRLYRDLAYIAAAVLGVICLEAALNVSLQDFWFDELGQRYRYWLALGLRVGIFTTVLVSVGLFVGCNLSILSRPLPVVPRSAPWFASFIVAAIVAVSATALWISLLGFLGATATGTTDPVFGKDISFFLLALPLYNNLLDIVLTVLAITIVLWAAIGLWLYPSAGRPWEHFGDYLRSQNTHFLHLMGAADADAQARSGMIWGRWMGQGLALAALLCLASGVSRFLDRYYLVVDGHSQVVAGGSFADIHFWIPAYNLVTVAWIVAAGILMAGACVIRFRIWLLRRPSRWLVPGGLFAILYFAASVVPETVEHVYVGPNQITLEQPFLLRSIAGTREAYNLDGASMEEREFAVSAAPLTRADLDKSGATLQDARIWDWRALEPQLQQIQGLRPYYTFAGVDIDRYMIDGAERQVMITARELNVERLPDQAKVWVNLALKYTHGYGAVAVPANEVDDRGNPVLWAHDIPLIAKGDLAVTQGAIYYGALTRDRVYVRTTEKEFDFPTGQANAETVYQGKGGIPLSNFWRKLVVSHETDGLRLFISEYFTPESRVLLHRNIVERVQRLAPFLTFDRDPYIVADGDHYSYIIDAYTSSTNYPYSEAYRGSLSWLRGRNYLRNSVKAVIDAYNGSVTFYVFDNHDPIINAYRRLLPGLFRDRSAMPENLQRHVRYPEDLFTVQAEMYGTYHMTNPMTFYNREDRWEVPHELYRDREIEVRPYYVIAQLPKAEKPEFLLMLPLSVAGKNQMAGWLAGLSDGENYGKMVAFRFPKGTFIDGPAQVESRINSDSRFSGDLTLWDQHGSQVIRGNLIVLPLNGSQLIAIEPVYIEAEQTKIPTLARIVLAQLLPDDRKIEWAPSLKDAENLLVGGSIRARGSSSNVETDDRLGRVRAVFQEMQRQYAAGNYTKYGELLQQLESLLTPESVRQSP